jgi:TPP-dependent pyruvate/acetoin dehydrogenase alpha subunit
MIYDSDIQSYLIAAENQVISEWEDGLLPYLIHLSNGNESQLIDIFKNVKETDWVLSTHRSHYHYILKGGSIESLLEKVRRGKSMFIFDSSKNFLTSSIVCGTPGIATGIALGEKLKGTSNKVWCFIGDAAEDEGHFYEAVRFVDCNKLNCTFIIEDNNRSVTTDVETRWGSNKRFEWPECVIRYHYTNKYPHAGSGTSKKIVFKNV